MNFSAIIIDHVWCVYVITKISNCLLKTKCARNKMSVCSNLAESINLKKKSIKNVAQGVET